MDTYDENRDGRFEMNELAKALKIEENYLNKIINKKSIKDKHIQVEIIALVTWIVGLRCTICHEETSNNIYSI